MGFRFICFLAERYTVRLRDSICRARLGEGSVCGIQILLAMPNTFMNLSGNAVKCLAKEYNVPPEDMLIIYDDVDLELGQMRLRQEGGHGGHKGMKSIVESLETREIPRLRFGIGRPTRGELTDFVLADFTKDESILLANLEGVFSKAFELYVQGDHQGAMIELNRKNE